jgi:hypothetical protein
LKDLQIKSAASEISARRLDEGFLLAVLNLGNDRFAHWDPLLIEHSKSAHPHDWTPDVQARMTAICRLAVDTFEKLRSLPRIRNIDESTQRNQLVKPLDDAFARFSMRTRFLVDFKGQSFLVTDSVAGFSNRLERVAMSALRDLMKRGETGNLRECGNPLCRAWFIAKRQYQKWCSGRCRQAMYESTESFKEQRRENYKQKKKGKPRVSKRKKARKDVKAASRNGGISGGIARS